MLLPLAQAAPPAGFPGGSMLLIVAMFAVMYFTMIRPQARQARLHRDMAAGLKKGDKVVTAGGIHGTIIGTDEQTILLRAEGDVRLRVDRVKVAYVKTPAKDTPAPSETPAA